MINLITINFNKKISFISVLFMLVSLLAIYFVIYYNASFNINDFLFLTENKLITNDFFNESLQLIELIEVLFIILLVQLEHFYNTDNFDSYFVTLVGKDRFFVSKLLTYFFIILLYTFFVFSGLTLIYLVRFKSIFYLKFILKVSFFCLLYSLIFFAISYIFLLLFRNYFSAMIVFIYYWIGKIIESKSTLIQTIFPKINLDVESQKVIFSVNNYYVICYVFVLFTILRNTYNKVDLKINS